MELRHLRLFAALAKFQHLTKASEMLGIDQPLASKHLRQLEKIVGGELVFRGKRPLQLTPLGEALAARIHPIIDGIDNLLNGLSIEAKNQPVRFIGNSDMIGFKLPPVIRRFSELHPDGGIRIQEAMRDGVIDALSNMDADVAILTQRGLPNNFDFIPLGEINPILITSMNHPLMQLEKISLQQIVRWPVILNSLFSETANMVKAAISQNTLKTGEIIELDSAQAVKRYAALGIGVAIATSVLIDPEDWGKLAIRKLDFLPSFGQIGLITVKDKIISENVRAFLNIAEEELKGQFDADYALSVLSEDV